MAKIIVVSKNTAIQEKNLSEQSVDIEDFPIHILDSLHLNKGKGEITKYSAWILDEFVISLMGWKDGNAGNENKTEIPPPEDIDLYFGDLVFIKSKDNIVVDFTKKDYNLFYEKSFGGFESLGSSDSEDSQDEEENEYDSDDSFIDNSEQIIDIKTLDDDYVPSEEVSSSDSNISSDSHNTDSDESLVISSTSSDEL